MSVLALPFVLVGDGQQAVQRARVGRLDGKVRRAFRAGSNVADELVALGGGDALARNFGGNVVDDALALIHEADGSVALLAHGQVLGEIRAGNFKTFGLYNGHGNRHLGRKCRAVGRGVARNVHRDIIASAVRHGAGIELERHLL